jgi:RNA polymerase sigma factor (TIGR02999 family)
MNEDEIPRLVDEWREGDQEALDRLVTLLYHDLRRLAHRHLKGERADHTLNTTALVHEAYLQLAKGERPTWRARPQFFALLSRVMRHVLVDYARRRKAAKRGGRALQVALDDLDVAVDPAVVELLDVDDALTRLAEKDAKLATMVECRFFGSLTNSEIAEVLDTSERTVERDWQRARAYLHLLLSRGTVNAP